MVHWCSALFQTGLFVLWGLCLPVSSCAVFVFQLSSFRPQVLAQAQVRAVQTLQ